ncbi:MAG: hypothetical protein ACNYPD_07490 [Candidatus Halichondribacter symbioticus]
MTYIKLLTALAGLALLTACGGGTGLTATNDTITPECMTNPFGDGCNRFAEALASQEIMCLADATADPSCLGDAGIATLFCEANPFDTATACGHEDYDDERQTMCLADIAEDPSCDGEMGIVTVFCKDDPFNTATACMADTYLPDRVADCITDGNAGIARCNNLFTASASNTCLTNPFTDACTSDTEFDDYADMARTNRVSFCASDNTNSSLCTALTACQANPFGAGCGAYFADTRISHCMTNDVVACPNVTTADWLASFTANGGTALTTTPNTTTRKNQFLQATPTGFASGANAGIRATFNSPQTDISIQTLTFASADTATGGLAFFGGELYSGEAGSETGTGNDFYYAGILAGTNLGAPITETITNARWTGQIRAASTSSNGTLDGTSNNFGVDITFDGAEGTIETIFAADPQFVYEIDGDFDENGIITGTVDYWAGDANGIHPTQFRSSYSPGTLRGIIGQNGAVGVFHSDNENSDTGSAAAIFAGGFVALPPSPCQVADTCVDTAAWLASFDTPPNTAGDYTRSATHEFLQGTTVGLDVGTVKIITVAPQINTLNLASLGGEAKNGMAWFYGLSGVGGDIEPYRYYSGILSGTNLGAPLTSADASVSVPWAGKIGASYLSSDRSDGTGLNKSDFELTVDFANNEIRAFVKRVSAFSDTDHFLLKAAFDGTGRFDGTIIHATFAGSVEAGAQTNVTNGVVTGIIGKQGAVGAFYGGADDTDDSQGNFAGGFVAAPPSE